MENASSTMLWVPSGILVALIIIRLLRLAKSPNLEHIPAIGPTSFLGSYWFALKFRVNCSEIIQEGYETYKTGSFRVADLTRWLIVLNRCQLTDIANYSEDTISFNEAVRDHLRFDYPFGREYQHNSYHLALIRSQLTRGLSAIHAELMDEMVSAFDETLALKDNEWKSITIVDTINDIVVRTTNRAFVGLPLCRDPDWMTFNIKSAIDVFRESLILRLFPMFMLPLVAKFIVKIQQRTIRGANHLGPLVKRRRKCMEEFGEKWPDKPGDFLQWCLDSQDEPLALLTQRILLINFATIHTSSNILGKALQLLAINPQYIQALREEVEEIVERHGWSKESVAKMRRIDSFLKETHRFEDDVIVGVARTVMKDVTLSDGTFLPKGTSIISPSHAIHHDESVYPNPNVFDPLRFVKLHLEQPERSFKYQMVAVNPEFLPFGLGKAACPGRFFAATVLKSMLAYIVLSYDIKVEDSSAPPKCLQFGNDNVVDPTAKIMLRRRAD